MVSRPRRCAAAVRPERPTQPGPGRDGGGRTTGRRCQALVPLFTAPTLGRATVRERRCRRRCRSRSPRRPAASASTSLPVCAAPSERLQLDVDHVVGEPAAVREALQVTGEHAEPVRLRGRPAPTGSAAASPTAGTGLGLTSALLSCGVEVGLDRARRALVVMPVRKISTRSLRGVGRGLARRRSPGSACGTSGFGDPGDDRRRSWRPCRA